MQFDQQAFRQKFLKHCLWMANFDKDHALRAAAIYERECDLLYGLYDRVKRTIQPHQPENHDDL